jgi:hypothetical protein
MVLMRFISAVAIILPAAISELPVMLPPPPHYRYLPLLAQARGQRKLGLLHNDCVGSLSIAIGRTADFGHWISVAQWSDSSR